MMDRDFLRLELVKLTYRPGLQEAAYCAIGDAKKLEDYVLESGASELKKPAAPVKASAAKKAKANDDNAVFR